MFINKKSLAMGKYRQSENFQVSTENVLKKQKIVTILLETWNVSLGWSQII